MAKPSISNWLSTLKSQTDLPSQSSNSTVVNENNDGGDEESDVSDRSVSEGDFETSDEVDIPETPAQSVSSTNIPLSILLDIQRSVKSLYKKFDKMEKAMKNLEKENKTLKEQNAMLAENVNDLNGKVVSLERSNSDLMKICENLESQSRRQNLKFYNIPEDRGETWDESERNIKDYIQNELGIDGNSVSVERAHRIQVRFQPRPIIAKFSF